MHADMRPSKFKEKRPQHPPTPTPPHPLPLFPHQLTDEPASHCRAVNLELALLLRCSSAATRLGMKLVGLPTGQPCAGGAVETQQCCDTARPEAQAARLAQQLPSYTLAQSAALGWRCDSSRKGSFASNSNEFQTKDPM